MTQTVRIVLADDHPIYRDGLARVMADEPDLQVVGQAGDGAQAAEMVARLLPDVVLLDVSMPQGGGIGALRPIMALPKPPHVAMLTASEADDDLMQAIKLGAMGYILKGVGATELLAVVRDLHAGRSYVSPGLAGRLLVAMRRRDTAEPNPLDDLSRREEEILKKLHLRNRVEAAMLARQHQKG